MFSSFGGRWPKDLKVKRFVELGEFMLSSEAQDVVGEAGQDAIIASGVIAQGGKQRGRHQVGIAAGRLQVLCSAFQW